MFPSVHGIVSQGGAGAVPPVTAYSVHFNGSTQYGTLADKPLFDATEFTLEAWIKPDTAPASHFILDRNAASDFGLRWLRLNTGKLSMAFYIGDSLYEAVGTTTISTGVWTHVAGVFNGTTAKLYVNGVEDGSLAAVGSANSGAAPFTIGRSNRFGHYFDGKIVDARYWSSDRSASVGAAITGAEADLVFAMDRDGQTGSGVVWKDAGPNGYDFTLVNAPTWSTDVPT